MKLIIFSEHDRRRGYEREKALTFISIPLKREVHALCWVQSREPNVIMFSQTTLKTKRPKVINPKRFLNFCKQNVKGNE
jgi:hypothetical protein